MKPIRVSMMSTALLCALVLAATAQDRMNPSTHVMVEAASVQWGPAPAVLNKGAQMAVLAGNPTQPGPFVLRLRLPAGYRISPHWHPSDENITVISGVFSVGHGDTFDPKATKPLSAGGYTLLPAEMRHFGWTKDGATIQVHGIGPFVINYVNPADDPSKAPAK